MFSAPDQLVLMERHTYAFTMHFTQLDDSMHAYSYMATVKKEGSTFEYACDAIEDICVLDKLSPGTFYTMALKSCFKPQAVDLCSIPSKDLPEWTRPEGEWSFKLFSF